MLHDCSPTAALSNTVCIADPTGAWHSVQKKTIQEFLEFGEVARIDTSILQCVLVTYFDVRDAQKVILQWADRAQPFMPAPHDFRTVQVNMVGFAQQHANTDFERFGEVAHVGMIGFDLLVEFFDMRASQALLVEAADCASPWMPQSQISPQLSLPVLPGAAGTALALTPLAKAALRAEEHAYAASNTSESQAEKVAGPVRTKITNKEFTKYDIDPAKLLSGEDPRTTVMVRNLVGPNARKNFLAYLEKCGLQDKHTFFYMPCKEHRNVPVGFAFVNFEAPRDVHCLYSMMKSELWSELIREPNSAKIPALSFARFQGHEELMAHFSSSAVLSRRNPEKRPSFRPNGESPTAAAAQKPKPAPEKEKPALEDSDLHAALAKGVEKINKLLMHEKAEKMESAKPAYVHAPGLQAPTKDAKRVTWQQRAVLEGISESDDGESQMMSSAAQGG